MRGVRQAGAGRMQNGQPVHFRRLGTQSSPSSIFGARKNFMKPASSLSLVLNESADEA